MAVTETLQGVGAWGLTLRDVPQDIVDNLEYFGHVVIHTGWIDYRKEGDAALTSGRYTGVLRKVDANDEVVSIGGAGMAMWLGDEDQKGQVIEDLITIDNLPFDETIRSLLPASVAEGTLFNIDETFKGTFQYVSPREAIDYVCETVDAEWKITGDAKLHAGRASDLFVTNPKTLIRRKSGGVDMTLRAYVGDAKTSQDVEEFTTRVVLLASGTEAATATASADINPALNPYRDLHGNPVVMTRLVSESSTDASNAPARAQLQLNRFTRPVDALALSTSDYDVKGDVSVGDYVWVLDEQVGLVDVSNEIVFKGQRLNPIKLRLAEMTWPIVSRMSVGYRHPSGKWYNLTDYLVPENGETALIVGEFRRSLSGATGGVIGSRPVADSSIPGQPTWVTPFIQSVYQSPLTGETRAQCQLGWLRPNNTDGTPIVDGDHYEIRWRSSSTPIFPVTWAQLGEYTWQELHDSGATWDNPIQYETGDWAYLYVPWELLNTMIIDLAPNMPYEAQIRAVDSATPPNTGEWSDLVVWQTNGDTIAPSQPAPPTVYASRLQVQIVHHLGQAGGGEFNLEPDLHHLEIHGEYEPLFTPSEETLLGKVMANKGMISGHLPAVGTVPIERTAPTYFKVIAVDVDGNKSNPSEAVQQTAELIDDAHISDLSVSKVTAGTISADWLLAGSIKTGVAGPRMEADADGLRLYREDGTNTVDLDADTGFATLTGTVQSGTGNQRVVMNPEPNGIARIDWYDDGSDSHITAVNFSGNWINQRETDASRTPDGGRIYWDGVRATYGFQRGVNYQGGITFWQDELITLRGKWSQDDSNPQSAIYVGNFDVNSDSASFGWGSTMATRMVPNVTIYFFAGTINRSNVDNLTPSGFGCRWDPSGPVRVLYNAFRINQDW
ncbi:hypothetical protein [Amycolatopsis tucumanensis]|uniref:Minor tail protein n=1 Tax=Amycolatopsis tucumanensis TaxID=401106 RepID=A0ABP7IY33_9PSEU|nr:hypothetical protein [Amycolatopsis tucumanensis]MCF6423353.1 hypothetical protein [Amycolatopsis tucumanensis]